MQQKQRERWENEMVNGLERKLADFTIYNQDLMTVNEGDILDTKISMTIFGGKVVYVSSN